VQDETLTLVPLALGLLAGGLALVAGVIVARQRLRQARATAEELVAAARAEAENEQKRILVVAQERMLAAQDDADQRERELEEKEASSSRRAAELERSGSVLEQRRRELERRATEIEQATVRAREAEQEAGALRVQAREQLERVAGLTVEQARGEVIAGVQDEARRDAARLARKIHDEAREGAEREARALMLQASQRVRIDDVVESTVTFLELPSDEMKGRIIGREGRNIRALEMATGIDLVVDDTPRSILISSFDPVRREVARVAIERLVEDGRIHPARIEEVVQRAEEEIESRTDEKGSEAAFSLGISDLQPRLVRLVGRMRYHSSHGQNLLQHCIETAQIAGFMAQEVGANAEIARRAGLLHEIGQVDDEVASHPILAAAELCARHGESEAVVHAVRAFHPDVEARSIEAMLVSIAGRMSDQRPGARKENLAVFVERLKRLEGIALSFPGVSRAYAVKAGKEIRVIVDSQRTTDQTAYSLCKQIARAVERELNYPGQIKVGLIRATRAVRFAV